MEMDYSKWWAGKIMWRDSMERSWEREISVKPQVVLPSSNLESTLLYYMPSGWILLNELYPNCRSAKKKINKDCFWFKSAFGVACCIAIGNWYRIWDAAINVEYCRNAKLKPVALAWGSETEKSGSASRWLLNRESGGALRRRLLKIWRTVREMSF